jgi:hypothetical protein
VKPERARRSWPIRALRALAVLLLLAGLAIAATVSSIEFGCRASSAPRPVATASVLAAPPADYRRPEVDSFLSYPEWFIVHAYEDLAAVLATRDESDFGYASSVSGYWRSLCRLNRVAHAYGGNQTDTKLMLYTIGFSFTLELAAKGAYESTVGALAEALRGTQKTALDKHIAQVARRYAVFLQQTPWYEFDFGSEVAALWQVQRAAGDSLLRHWERRLAMSVEFGAKALYAKLIGAAAGAMGTVDRTTLAVFSAGDEATLDAWLAASGTELVARLSPREALVRSDRYRAFTRVLVAAAHAGAQPVEVAGNRRALVTVVAAQPPAATVLFAVPLSSEPGQQRFGIDTRVDELSALLVSLQSAGGRFEHFYDY